MNLEQIHDVNYLKSLSQDKENLNKEVFKTKGYVLHVMEKNKIIPPMDYLVEKINPYALLFIIKNYDLNRTQIKEIRGFFKSTVENKITKEILTNEEIEQYIEEEHPLPRNTSLTFEIIKNSQVKLNKILNKNKSDTTHILEKSVKKLSIEEFLSLDDNFLLQNTNLFNSVPQYFSNISFKQKYKDLTLKINKRNDRPDLLNDFVNYPFEAKDKSFLLYLMDINSDRFNSSSYRDLAKMNGVTSLIPLMEHFKQYGYNDLSAFTLKELESNKKNIQDIIIEKAEKSYYDSFSDLFRLYGSVEQFKTIVDENFFNNYVKDNEKIDLRGNDRDNEDSRDKYAHVQKLFLNWVIKNYENDDSISKINVKDIGNIIKDISENGKHTDDLFIENAHNFYLKVFPKFLTTNKFEKINGNFSSFLNVKTSGLIDEVAEKNPSINFLAILLADLYSGTKYRNKAYDLNISKMIEKMIPRLDKFSVKELCGHYDHSLPLFTSFAKKHKDSYETNFLNYENKDYTSLFNKSLLFDIKKDFREKILSSKVELSDKFVSDLLYKMEENKQCFSFLEKYFKIHEEKIKENKYLIRLVSKNPLGKKLIKLENNSFMDNEYQDLLINIDNYNKIQKEIKEIIPDTVFSDDYEEDSEEEEDSPELKVLNEIKTNLFHKIKDNYENFTFEYLDEKIRELIKENNFSEYFKIKKGVQTSNHGIHFINHVNNSDFHTLLKNIENESFRELIQETVSYNGETAIKISKLNNIESTVIAELLLPLIKEKENIFLLFDEKKRGFSNEFIIKHMPLEMFYSYKLCPPTDKSSKEILTRTYSNQEILDGFKNVEKTTGFFAATGVNEKYNSMLSDNFHGRDIQYKELLELTKQSNPKFYAILCNSSIIEKNIDYGYKTDKTRDQAVSEYVKENFDIDVVLKGLKIILDEIKCENRDEEKKFNRKNALYAVESFIYNTYYDVEENGRRKYLSPFTRENSEKIVNFLFNEAPVLLMSLHNVGNISNVSKHIEEFCGNYIKDNTVIDKMLNPSGDTYPDNFSLGNKETKEKALMFINGLINHYIQERNVNELDYISHKIEIDTFIRNQIDYEVSYKHNVGSHSEMIYIANSDLMVKERLNIAQRHFSLDMLLAEKSEKKSTVKRSKI